MSRGRSAALSFGALLLAAPAPAQSPLHDAYGRAEALRAAGAAPEEVRAAYRQALELFLQLPAGSRDRADWLPAGAFCAWQADRPALAADLFEASIGAGRRDAFHAEHLLRAQLAAGRHEEALRAARDLQADLGAAVDRVMVQEGGLHRAEAWRHGDRWLRAGDTEAGLWVFRALARAAGDHPDALANLALVLRHVGREDECEATYRRALRAAPDDAALWNDLGLFLLGAGRLDEAEAAFLESRGREPAPPTGPATTNLVRLGLRTGRHALADPAAALAALLAKRPDAAVARQCYVDVLTSMASPAPPFPTSAPDRSRIPR